jgi:cell division protein FtsB
MNENDQSNQKMSWIKSNVWFIVGILVFGALCVLAGSNINRSSEGNSDTDKLRNRIESIQQRNTELIADNERLTRELAESTIESRELGGIIESALELAQRSANGFDELTNTLGSGSSELAVIIERQRTINTMVNRLQTENRQLIGTLNAITELGRADGSTAPGE